MNPHSLNKPRIILMLIVLALSPLTAQAISFDIGLDPGQSVPTPTLGGAAPSGTATVNVNTITGDVSVNGSYTGMTSSVSASHIHGLAPPGSAAGVLVPLTVSGGTSGTITSGGTLSQGALTGLLAGETYINVHTANNGPGEIRGQIVDPDILMLDITLDAGQSVPSPVLGGATPSGTARVVVDTSSGDVEITGTYAGMTSNVTAAHLHGLAGPGSTTGVLFGLTIIGGTDGTFSGIGALSLSDLTGLLAGDTYINVHTVNNGPGEIRGQVVPEPGTGILVAIGCAGFALLRRRSC